MEPTRASHYDGLILWFGARSYDPPGRSMARLAAVAEEIFDDERVGAAIKLFDREEDAFEFLADAVLDGYQADGVYDLDTAEKIDVHVARPLVTRAKEQGVTANPIAE